jgi:hypothetical protein
MWKVSELAGIMRKRCASPYRVTEITISVYRGDLGCMVNEPFRVRVAPSAVTRQNSGEEVLSDTKVVPLKRGANDTGEYEYIFEAEFPSLGFTHLVTEKCGLTKRKDGVYSSVRCLGIKRK